MITESVKASMQAAITNLSSTKETKSFLKAFVAVHDFSGTARLPNFLATDRLVDSHVHGWLVAFGAYMFSLGGFARFCLDCLATVPHFEFRARTSRRRS